MKVMPISDYLSDFDAENDIAQMPSLVTQPVPPKDNPPVAEVPLPPSQSALDKAYEEGILEGRRLAEGEANERVASLKKVFEKQIETEKENRQAHETGELANDLLRRLGEIETRVANSVAEILKPFLAQSLHERAIEDLTTILSNILRDPDIGKITVTGPEVFCRALQTRLSEAGGVVEVFPDEGKDIRVEVDNSVLETRMAAWADLIGVETE